MWAIGGIGRRIGLLTNFIINDKINITVYYSDNEVAIFEKK